MRLKYFAQFYGFSFRFLCPLKENVLKNSLTPSYYSAMTMQHRAIRWFAQNRKVGNQCSLRGDLVIPGNPHRNWILFNLKLKITSSTVIAIRRKKELKRNHHQISNNFFFLEITLKINSTLANLLLEGCFRYNCARCLQDIKSWPTIQYAITPPMLQIKLSLLSRTKLEELLVYFRNCLHPL